MHYGKNTFSLEKGLLLLERFEHSNKNVPIQKNYGLVCFFF